MGWESLIVDGVEQVFGHVPNDDANITCDGLPSVTAKTMALKKTAYPSFWHEILLGKVRLMLLADDDVEMDKASLLKLLHVEIVFEDRESPLHRNPDPPEPRRYRPVPFHSVIYHGWRRDGPQAKSPRVHCGA